MAEPTKLQEKFDKRNQLEEELKNLERNIYDLETSYLEDTCNTGNVIRGWENYFANTKQKSIGTTLKRAKFNPNERIFSLSSTTSPANQKVEEVVEKNVTQYNNSMLNGMKRFSKKSKIGKNTYDNDSPRFDNMDSSQQSDEFEDHIDDSEPNELISSKKTKKINKKKKTKS